MITKVLFSELKLGDSFVFEEKSYIKTETVYVSEEPNSRMHIRKNAVMIKSLFSGDDTGKLFYIQPDSEVKTIICLPSGS